MGSAEEKWFKSLERVMKQKPKTVEVIIHERRNSKETITSAVCLMRKGVIHDTQDGDLMAYDPTEHAISSFEVEGITGNNHGY